ncbi:MAG: hypothetical protein PHV99_02260 [Candidatus Pacebacteria bacterium]|nr:hypothetical protein [Candidatus Paceibacterota bacterium]
MNIHPFFVHFPIALLAVYSLLEIGTYVSPALRRQPWMFPVKAFLLFVGAFAAFAALVTGGIAGDLIEGTSARAYILEVHASFAGVTTLLYIVLAAAYLTCIGDTLGWGNRIAGLNNPFMRIWSVKKFLAHLVLDTWVLPVLAFLALVGMIITGVLGAAIVYGPGIDPFVSFTYHLFWAQ